MNQGCFSVTIRSPSFQEYPLNTDSAGAAPPDAFGPFRVLHQIGAGALGPVFRAYQPEQDRLVAVKLFRIDVPPERSHQLVSQLERLIAVDLTHPAIAAPIATGLSDVCAFLAMDFVAADSLDIVIRDQTLSTPADVVRVATQMASALDLAAAIDITHGALHPRDVLLSADDVRVTGIGIARALEEIGTSAPVRRPYTAPERAYGGAWDRRADVFSLAALMFELLTRRRISGPGDQPQEAFRAIPGINADTLNGVFDRALAEHPRDRFATAGDFAKALQAALERKRSVAPKVGPTIQPPKPPLDPVAPFQAEELPLFTDSMIGQASEPTTASDAVPPPLVDAGHEALGSDLSFREVPLSMVDSMHEPELRSNGHGAAIDDFHSAAHDANGRRMTIDEFTEAVPDTTARDIEPMPASRRHPDTPQTQQASSVSLKQFEPESEVKASVASAVPAPVEIPIRPAPFENADSSPGSSSGVWPLMLALVLGIALGFGMAMLLLGRDRVPQAPQQASTGASSDRPATEVRDEPVREVTEQTVASEPKAAAQAKPEQPPSATTPVRPSASAPAATAKPSAEQPSTVAPVKPQIDRDSRAAKTPTPRIAGRTPVTPSRTTPTRPAPSASRTSSAAPARPPARSTASAPTKSAAQAPTKPGTGSLAIESRPAGASVYVDGRRVGVTPLVLDTLKPGQYTVGIDSDGYKRWATTVRVTADERSRVAASLER